MNSFSHIYFVKVYIVIGNKKVNNSDSSCTYLGSLGFITTKIKDHHYSFSFQGAKVSTVTAAASGILDKDNDKDFESVKMTPRIDHGALEGMFFLYTIEH
jgi:hypothetical protein